MESPRLPTWPPDPHDGYARKTSKAKLARVVQAGHEVVGLVERWRWEGVARASN